MTREYDVEAKNNKARISGQQLSQTSKPQKRQMLSLRERHTFSDERHSKPFGRKPVTDLVND
jgi:hypothetical protein